VGGGGVLGARGGYRGVSSWGGGGREKEREREINVGRLGNF
jgi:hypothetical protein